jgi:hypothetical protein
VVIDFTAVEKYAKPACPASRRASITTEKSRALGAPAPPLKHGFGWFELDAFEAQKIEDEMRSPPTTTPDPSPAPNHGKSVTLRGKRTQLMKGRYAP